MIINPKNYFCKKAILSKVGYKFSAVPTMSLFIEIILKFTQKCKTSQIAGMALTTKKDAENTSISDFRSKSHNNKKNMVLVEKQTFR